MLLEPEDLERMPDGDHYELIDGVPVEKHMGAKSDELSVILGSLLVTFVMRNRLGRVYGSSTGFRSCFPHRPKLVRKPDVSFVELSRLPLDGSPQGDFKIAPDLAVEVVSPNDTYEEVEEKINDYLKAAVKLIWIISPNSKNVMIRRLDGTCAVIDVDGSLSGEIVIPGFTCRVAELFV